MNKLITILEQHIYEWYIDGDKLYLESPFCDGTFIDVSDYSCVQLFVELGYSNCIMINN